MQKVGWLTKFRLLFSGWYPGRNVWANLVLPGEFEILPIAKEILSEFGKLRFGPRNEHTRLEPAAAEEVAGDIHRYESKLGRRLYPLGYREHQDREYFLVDEDGVVYLLSEVLEPIASSFDRLLVVIAWNVAGRIHIDRDLKRNNLKGKGWHLDDNVQDAHRQPII